ncbi:MAG: GAF domain-containing sensor histidine kinase [Fibrobacter sp.]|nr:GAF domain-containing sensor histidine kinase [Fibrobacter sp.]
MTKKISNGHGRTLHNRDGKIAGWCGMSVGISDSKEEPISLKELLNIEIKKRIEAEKEIAFRDNAIEAIHSIMTAFFAPSEVVIKKIISSISTIFSVPFVAVGVVEKSSFTIFQNVNGSCERIDDMEPEEHPCGIVFEGERIKLFSGDFKQHYPLFCNSPIDFKVYFGTPVVNGSGLTLGNICICTDNENRIFKKSEISLVEIFAKCLGYVLERKAMEHQLLQSQEMKNLGQLTSGVAHEVRNPLNGILVITDVLGKELEENPEYSSYVGHIRKQVIRLTNLMNDLLNLAKPAGSDNLLPISIVELISSILNSWKHASQYRERTVKMKYCQEAENVSIRVDRLKFEQVLINLLENGCAHSCQGQDVVIDIKCAENFVVIQVIDSGTGIKPEYLSRFLQQERAEQVWGLELSKV